MMRWRLSGPGSEKINVLPSGVTDLGTALNSVAKSCAGLALASLAVGSAWAQAPTPLRIGVIGGFTGVFSDLIGGEVEAAQMAVDEMGGKVLGRPIEILSADHQNKPDIGVAIARKWYDVDGVSMITGIDTSSVALNPIIKFTTLFGMLAVEMAVVDPATARWLGVVLLAVALVFVYRSFYAMRIAGRAAAAASNERAAA